MDKMCNEIPPVSMIFPEFSRRKTYVSYLRNGFDWISVDIRKFTSKRAGKTARILLLILLSVVLIIIKIRALFVPFRIAPISHYNTCERWFWSCGVE